MNRFKNILVVFDRNTDNRALLDQAKGLAQRNQASLTVVDVIADSPRDFQNALEKDLDFEAQPPEIRIIEDFAMIDSPDRKPGDWNSDSSSPGLMVRIQEQIIQEEQRSLQQFAGSIQAAGIQVNSRTIHGIPFIVIIYEVSRNHHDLVMITAEGKGGLKEALFGSTTLHLIRKCPCPVWVIKPGKPRPFKRILAAVDLLQDDKDRTALAKKIMELASSLTRLEKGELLIIHTWSLFSESIFRGRGDYSTEEVEKLLQESKGLHRQWLIDLLNEYPLEDLKYEVYLLKGEAGLVIPELAQNKDVDLIVMGTVSRAGIAGLLIGNTAEKVLQQVSCSMLTVKPDGFVTPVKLDPV